MTGIWLRFARMGWLCLAFLITACGGGGGGGDGDGDGDDGGMRVSFDTRTLALTVLQGDTIGGSQVIVATASGVTGNEALYVGAEVEGQGIRTPIPIHIDTAARKAYIEVRPDPSLAAGTYSGRLHLLACRDPGCNSHVPGSPHTVTTTTTVLQRLSASVASLDFASPVGMAPQAQSFTATTFQGAGRIIHSVTYAGTAGWLQVAQQGNVFAVQPAATLPAGSYAAFIRLDVEDDPRQSLSVVVRLEVGNRLVVPGTLDVTVTSATPASATAGEVSVTATHGLEVGHWTAQSTVPWLVIDTPDGRIGTPIHWHLDPAQFGALANGAAHTGDIVVEGDGNAAARIVAVTLQKHLAELDGMDHLAVLAGEAGEVLLYGSDLDQLAAPAQHVAIAGVAPARVTRLSNRLISVQVDAMAEGVYPVTLATVSGLPSRTLQLQVLAARDHGYQAIETTDQKEAMIWDARTRSVFVVNRSESAVMRFQLGGSVTQPTASISQRSIPSLINIGLLRDGGSLLALTADGTLEYLDPDGLGMQQSRSLGVLASEAGHRLPLMVTGDNRLWYPSGIGSWGSLAVYDLWRTAFEPLPNSSQFLFYNGPWAGLSRNGQRLLMVQTRSLSPQPPMLRRDAVDGVLGIIAASNQRSFDHIGSDHRGRRWLLDGAAVVDFDLNVEGLIQRPVGWLGRASAMSRDGTRGYVFSIHTDAIGQGREPDPVVHKPRVYVFDTSTPVGAEAPYPMLGFVELEDYPSCRISLGNCAPFLQQLLLTDDDRTLLVGGDRKLVVAPVPPALQGGTPAVQNPTRANHKLQGSEGWPARRSAN